MDTRHGVSATFYGRNYHIGVARDNHACDAPRREPVNLSAIVSRSINPLIGECETAFHALKRNSIELLLNAINNGGPAGSRSTGQPYPRSRGSRNDRTFAAREREREISFAGLSSSNMLRDWKKERYRNRDIVIQRSTMAPPRGSQSRFAPRRASPRRIQSFRARNRCISTVIHRGRGLSHHGA